jgi:hypothetical protein
MFDSFSTWRGHEMEHRRQWSCPLCTMPCKDQGETEAHLMRSHNDTVESCNLDTLLRTSSHPSEFLLASDCPFCDWNANLRKQNPVSDETELSVPSKRFMRHLGRHLEEIALFVIPQPDQEDEDSDTISSDAVHAPKNDDNESLSTLSSFRSTLSERDIALTPSQSTNPTNMYASRLTVFPRTWY